MKGNRNAPELLATLRTHARVKSLELDVGDGWLPLVEECHAAVVAEFPDYELLAVKQKYGELAFQAFPWPSSHHRPWTDEACERIEDLTDSFRERSAEVCERCGSPGTLHEVGRLWLTLCEACRAAASRPPGWRPWRRR